MARPYRNEINQSWQSLFVTFFSPFSENEFEDVPRKRSKGDKRNERPPKAIIRIITNTHNFKSQAKPNQNQTKPKSIQKLNPNKNQINMKSIIIFTAVILPFSSHANVSNGACARIHEPVFCTSTPTSKDRHMFSNLCLAIEAGFASANCGPEFSVDPIDPDFSVDPIDPDFNVDSIDPDEVCATIHEPVVCTSCPACEDQNEFSNLCFAKVAGFDSKNCKPKPIDLGCTMIHEPVVCTATPNSRDSNKFSNICEAEKAGFDSNNCTLKTGGLRGLKPTM